MVSREDLLGHWVHSHEEDTEDLKVFRRQGFEFPPSRGREAFELRADGSVLARQPGPVDVPEETPGAWELEGETLGLRPAEKDSPKRKIEVVAVEPEKLVVREQHG